MRRRRRGPPLTFASDVDSHLLVAGSPRAHRGRGVRRPRSGAGSRSHARRRLVAGRRARCWCCAAASFGVAVPNLPCQLPGGDSCPPADDAAELVPGDALAYVHANLDPETEQYRARGRARRRGAAVQRSDRRPRRRARSRGRVAAPPTSSATSAPGSAARRRSPWSGERGGPPSRSSCSRSPTPAARASSRRDRGGHVRGRGLSGRRADRGRARARERPDRGLPRDRADATACGP